MPLIEDEHSDTVGRIIFSIEESNCYQAISEFYRITGSVPYKVESRGDGCVIHLVRLRSLPSLLPMGITMAPEYTVDFQTDSFAWGISRIVIRNNEKQCVVRYERDSSGSGWSTFANDKARLKYYTD